MKFNEDLKKYVPTQQLWKDYGGELNFDYDHKAYWPALNKECDRRREAFKQRWIEAGKQIGEYEDYLRGGEQKCLRDLSGETEKHSEGVKVSDETPDIASLKV